MRLASLLVGVYDDPDQMSSEIELVSELLTDAAEKLRPCVQTQRKARWRDDTLSHLCAQTRAACAARKEAGSPGEGALFDEKGRLQTAVRKKMFASRDGRRFKTPQQKSRCAKLAVRGEVVQDPELLQVCAENFQKLTKSRVESGDIVP